MGAVEITLIVFITAMALLGGSCIVNALLSRRRRADMNSAVRS